MSAARPASPPMARVYGALIALWCSVAWVPFPLGFLLVRLVDPRQGDRMAFGSGIALAAGASLPILLVWLVALLVAASRTRRWPALGGVVGLLLVAAVVGVPVSAVLGQSLGPYGGLLFFPAAATGILLLVLAPLGYAVVGGATGLNRRPGPTAPRPSVKPPASPPPSP